MGVSNKYLSTDSLLSGLRSNTSPYNVMFLGGGNPYTILVDGEEYFIYIKNLSPAQLSNNNPDVWRVQLPVKEEFEHIKNSASLFILLGYDATNDVYTTWNPYWCKQRLNVGKSVSLYSRYSLQQHAHLSGQIEKMYLNNESDVVCFSAKLLYQYIKTIKEFFPSESLYVAKGSRINKRIISDPQELFELFLRFDDCSKFETYMSSIGQSLSSTKDYVRHLRFFKKEGFFEKYKSIFLRCTSIADYDEAIKEFRNQPDVLAIDTKNHGYLRAALRHYVKFMKVFLSYDNIDQSMKIETSQKNQCTTPLDPFGKLTELDYALIEQLRPYVIGEDYPDYDEMISIAVKYYPKTIDDNMAYSDWISLFKKTNWKKIMKITGITNKKEEITKQKRTQKLRIIWPDGHTMQTKKPSDTFVYVIEHNCPDLIMSIKFNREVISKEPFPDFPSSKRSQQYIKAGYWVNTNFSLPDKKKILQKISDELNLNLIVEIVEEDDLLNDCLQQVDQKEAVICKDDYQNKTIQQSERDKSSLNDKKSIKGIFQKLSEVLFSKGKEEN